MNEKIEKKVREEIEKKHKLGDQAGGSGHLSHVSYGALEIDEPEEVEREGKKVLLVKYRYKTYVQSEFDYAEEDDKEDWRTQKHEGELILK